MKILDALLPGTRQKVLALFLLHPEEQYHVREVFRRVGVKQGVVQRELSALARVGVLSRRTEGRQTYYTANPACPVYDELRGLVLKTVGLVDVLGEALEPLGRRARVAFVYGSLAKAEEGPVSDVDLMVVGDAEFGDVVQALGQAQEQLRRDVNPTVYPVAELRQKLRAGHHFLTTVLAEDKLFVIGDADELERLAGQRLAEGTQDEPTGDR